MEILKATRGKEGSLDSKNIKLKAKSKQDKQAKSNRKRQQFTAGNGWISRG